MTIEEMVEKFQCPGCIYGRHTKCGYYQYSNQELRCLSHTLGTLLEKHGPYIALGLPRGFNRTNPYLSLGQEGMNKKIHIRLFLSGDQPEWDEFNIPVWALVQDGFLYVRTFAPRVDWSWIDVIEGGSLELVPHAVNVADFYHEIN